MRPRVVIADTSPIRYLLQIGQISLLQKLFQWISVRAWIGQAPPWLLLLEATSSTKDPDLQSLDPGERSAIELGIACSADLILIDDRRGTAIARRKGIQTTGTLGILDLAASRGLVDSRQAVEQLKHTNFRYRQALVDAILANHGDAAG